MLPKTEQDGNREPNSHVMYTHDFQKYPNPFHLRYEWQYLEQNVDFPS